MRGYTVGSVFLSFFIKHLDTSTRSQWFPGSKNLFNSKLLINQQSFTTLNSAVINYRLTKRKTELQGCYQYDWCYLRDSTNPMILQDLLPGLYGRLPSGKPLHRSFPPCVIPSTTQATRLSTQSFKTIATLGELVD